MKHIHTYNCHKCNIGITSTYSAVLYCSRCGNEMICTSCEKIGEKEYSFKFKTEKRNGMFYEDYLSDIVDEFEHEANTILNEIVKAKDRFNKILDELDERFNKT